MASNNADKTRDLRLIDGEEGATEGKSRPASGGNAGELVS